MAFGFKFIAVTENRYPRKEDAGFYEVLCGRNASLQTYEQHILSDDEWRRSIRHLNLPERIAEEALNNRQFVMENSTATLQKASLPIVKWPKTIRQLCEEGAVNLNCDLTDPVYKERLDRELDMISAKGFDDYMQIIADLMTFARGRMRCGPGRGSSAGSLVCYLTGITTIDPIFHDTIFERFIDVTRNDLPDVDCDFSDTNRYMVFDYLKDKYGADRVAKLGTVAMFQPRSALAEVGSALKIPGWKLDAVSQSLIERSSGDARAEDTLEDTIMTMPSGIALLKEFPESIIATRFEGHPRHAGIHAAGIILSEKPIAEYVAINGLNGAIMADKKDAEGGYDFLKIDALGLTQLSVFEDCLRMAGLPSDYLENIPLEDDEAFKILRDGKFSGIFQWMGMALQSITKQIYVDRFEDLAAITSLARPGPLASGGAHEWVRRRNGTHPVTYDHPLIQPHLEKTFGMIVYQENVLQIGRQVGNLSWEQVTLLRRAMSKTMGVEYMNQFGDEFKKGAEANGITDEAVRNKIWKDLVMFGAYGFNRSHAIAYGMISYQCCYLKAKYPFEFAAATLSHESDPAKQILMLRELVEEGYDYVPIDKNISGNQWSVGFINANGDLEPIENAKMLGANSIKRRVLVGPLSNVKGIGPKLSNKIISDREEGIFSPRAEKILKNPKTNLDSLFPIRDAFNRLIPDPSTRNIFTKPIPIGKIVSTGQKYDVLVFCIFTKINPRDEEERVLVERRGYHITDGMTSSLNLQAADDTGQIFCKINRFNYKRMGQDIIDRGGVGKHLYVVKGKVFNGSFLGISVDAVRYIGPLNEKDEKQDIAAQ
jgi:DNA-directed DNA polymerase III PolC